MTLHDIATDLHGLALGHFINGQKVSRQWIEGYLRRMFQGSLKLKDRVVLEICLPDGRWLMTVNRFNDKPDGFDYWIPENRDQENRLVQQITA